MTIHSLKNQKFSIKKAALKKLHNLRPQPKTIGTIQKTGNSLNFLDRQHAEKPNKASQTNMANN
jgi:hypothetical protein